MEKEMDNQVMQEVISNFKNKKILLIGDTILDIYVYGTAIGKSLETPTIVAKEENVKVSFGGSSLVARNILELGAKLIYIAVLGDDEEAKNYKNCSHRNLTKEFIVENGRKTTIKKRFWIDNYKLLQIDNLDEKELSKRTINKIKEAIKKQVNSCDIIVISDYRHGLLNKGLISFIKKIGKDNKKNIFVDSQISHKKSNHHYYKGCSLICLSKEEAKAIDSKFIPENNSKVFTNLRKELGNSNICVKLGENGSLAFINNSIIKNSAMKVKAIDTCGAGDAFLAVLCLSDMDYPYESLQIANYWAGLSTKIFGTNPPKKSDLIDLIKKY